MKSILKPTFGKVLLALGLFVLASWVWRIVVTSTVGDLFPWGFPLGFYEAWGPCRPSDTCEEWRFSNFWLDLAIWYLAAGALIQRGANRSRAARQ